ncbi:MAG: hypothetical protein JSU77_05060 [Fidelibacterota bacterium]|nr:MAG: hypothetical protein JSU77_05060 [Candidatus Neomarinimicrobiota bacterium]
MARAVYHLIYEDNQTVFGGYMIEAGDGGYLLTGTKVIQFDPVEMGDITLIRTDVSGQVVWENTWGGDVFDGANSIIQADDGNLVIAGKTRSNGAEGADSLLIKIDQDGNEIWSSVIGDTDMIDVGKVLAETNDGGFVIAGESGRDPYTWEADMTLVKFYENDQQLWEQTRVMNHSMLGDLLQYPDGGYVISGSTYTGPVFNLFLIKTGLDGKLVS